MTNPKLTDEAVGRLPLSRARAELLEDIMAAAPIESVTDVPVRRPRRRGMLIAVGTAAATVAALFAVPAMLDAANSPTPGDSTPAASADPSPASEPTRASAKPATQPSRVTSDRLVLTAPGWTLDYSYEGEGHLEARYVNGDQSVDLYRSPAELYADYYEDRSHITTDVEPLDNDRPSANPTLEPTPGAVNGDLESTVPDNDVTPSPAPGEPVTLLGQPGEMWAYSANDHTTIGVVQRGWYPEVRGSGMEKAAYLELLVQVRTVSDAEYDAALPESFVSDAERRRVITEMTADMTMPDGLTVSSDQSDRYQLGAEVSGAVACVWLDRWSKAHDIGDTDLEGTAGDALAGARNWAVLKEMEPVGDYPEVLWGYVDRVTQGEVPTGYQSGLGCH